jgi:hypothetical protein
MTAVQAIKRIEVILKMNIHPESKLARIEEVCKLPIDV